MNQFYPIILSVVIFGSANVSYGDHKHTQCPYHEKWQSHGMGARENLLDYTKDLNLTDKQVVKLNAIQVSSKEKRIELKNKIDHTQDELNKLSHEKEPNRKRIAEVAENIGSLKGDLIKLRVNSLLDERDVLTKEQKERLKGLFSEKDDETNTREVVSDLTPECVTAD